MRSSSNDHNALLRHAGSDEHALDLAAAVLDSLIEAGTIERALILGWDARDLVGLQRAKPHDHQARAGLVYSMRPGGAGSDIRDTGCTIAIAETNVHHLWKRAPLTDFTPSQKPCSQLPLGT